MLCVNPDCRADVHDDSRDCAVCGTSQGFPNVRAAERERDALCRRYDTAVEDARTRNADHTRASFEAALADSHAVVNVSIRHLESFLTDPKSQYATYWKLVDAGTRRAADQEDDHQRRATDSRLFGGYANEIRFAALSLDGRGLISYGDWAMRLKPVAVEKRASVLEENSYDFMHRHDVHRTGIPSGHRATWADRGHLAVAKLASHLEGTTSADEFATLLLFSDGNRANDRFMEVHVYGRFDQQAVAGVRGPSEGINDVENALINSAKERSKALGIAWSVD